MSRIYLIQPNKCRVTMDIWDESVSCFTKEDFENDPKLRGRFKADLMMAIGDFDSDVSYRTYQITDKTFYFDHKGIYTYPKQKEPIYYWEPQNIEEDYENWSKDKTGYKIPINEPRKLKKDYF